MTSDLGQLAQRVATHVRQQIPRSANRMRSTSDGSTEWLRAMHTVEYGKFMLAISRLKSKGVSKNELQTVRTQKKLFFTKKVTGIATVKELKDAIADFIQIGKIDGKPIDLSYKVGVNSEQAYSAKFGAALAEFMNAKGFRRKNGQPFTADRVMSSIGSELLADDRFLRIGGNKTYRPPFPTNYITSSARNAFRFGIGNCQECACAAYATLLHTRASGGVAPVRIELVYGESKGDEHYFVLLNRTGTKEAIRQDVDHWLDDPTVAVCDPWITDEGLGGLLTAQDAGMVEVRDFLDNGLTVLEVCSLGNIGDAVGDGGIKDHDKFHLPVAFST